MATKFIDEITCSVKTILRPRCLRRLLDSIQKKYPGMKVVVVDDGPEPNRTLPAGKWLTYIHVPFDTGQGAGRNIAADEIKTKYLWYMDDDFIVGKETSLEIFYKALDAGVVDLIAGQVIEGQHIRQFHGLLEIEGDCLTYKRSHRGLLPIPGTIASCRLVDIVANFFLAKTEQMREIRWDPELHVQNHSDFFLRAKDKLLIGFTEDVGIHHLPLVESEQYRLLRRRNERGLWLAKHGLSRVRYQGTFR